jgi:hypothetical protein
MLRYKHPFEYELSPDTLDKGLRWLTLSLKNKGNEGLAQLDVRLHSADTSFILVYGTGEYIPYLKPDEEGILSFQVLAGALFEGMTELYVNMTGGKDGDPFYWESPWLNTMVAGEVAELESLFVLTHPYTTIGKTFDVEATIKALDKSEGLNLYFWTDTPSGKYEELAKVKTKKLAAGDRHTLSAKITPKETGYYKVYATLYDNRRRRIGRKTSTIWVQK